MTVFIFACIGLALVHHYYQLVILRCMQSFGSASTIAIGSGILADVTSRQDRGGYMGVFQAGSLLPLGK
jgi:MFS family permease